MWNHTGRESRKKTIDFLKWFSLIWIVANYGLLELSSYWVGRGWPTLLNGAWPFTTKAHLIAAALLMAPGVLALIALWTLIIQDKLK